MRAGEKGKEMVDKGWSKKFSFCQCGEEDGFSPQAALFPTNIQIKASSKLPVPTPTAYLNFYCLRFALVWGEMGYACEAEWASDFLSCFMTLSSWSVCRRAFPPCSTESLSSLCRAELQADRLETCLSSKDCSGKATRERSDPC